MAQTQIVIETMAPPDVYLGPSSVHGRGVYAARDFKSGECVEECPYLYTDQHPITMDFVFEYKGLAVLPLGYGAIYNHSDIPNLKYFINPESETISYIAIRDLNMGEELFVSYGKMWWEDRQYPKINPNPDSRFQLKNVSWPTTLIVITLVIWFVAWCTNHYFF